MKLSILFLMFFFVSGIALSQNTGSGLIRYTLNQQAENCLEGFGHRISGEEISYHSSRVDCKKAIITRATTGKMAVVWETAPVSIDYKQKQVRFIWLAGLDINHGSHDFSFEINGESLLVLQGEDGFHHEISGKEGSKLSFYVIYKDQFGDAFGYMILTLPTASVHTGKPVKIKVTGGNDGSMAWYMTFQCSDAAHFLKEQAAHEGWLDLVVEKNSNNPIATITAPVTWKGRKVTAFIGEQMFNLMLEQDASGHSEAQFRLHNIGLTRNATLEVMLNQSPVVYLPGLFWEGGEYQLGKVTLIRQKGYSDQQLWKLETRIIYSPQLVRSVRDITSSVLRNGSVGLMNSSHQDIAWMDSPEKCMIDRDTMLLTPLMKKLKMNPDYRFNIEDVLMIREYLHRHPEVRNVLSQFLLNGHLQCGASYNMPYEEMYFGESLIRQFYLGKKWLEEQFPGYKSRIYWSVDVPGRTLQMPQILKKSGVPYMVLSRQEEGIYHWYGPDSSYITVYSPGHYANAFPALNQGFEKAVLFLGKEGKKWEQFYVEPSPGPVLPVLSDWDMSVARDYSALTEKWSSLRADLNLLPGSDRLQLPPIQMITAETFFKKLEQNHVDYNKIEGERPDIWIYIHGPSHHKALNASRRGDILLPAAEKFATVNALLEKTFAKYPQNKLNKAWENKIYPDHGWGGKHGDITDGLFRRKLENSAFLAKEILRDQLYRIAGKIKMNRKDNIPLVVFNSLSWKRSDPVTVEIKLPEGFGKDITLVDSDGKDMITQLDHIKTYADGSLCSAGLTFIAKDIPSVGYRTYYIKSLNAIRKNAPLLKSESPAILENFFYRVTLFPGGIQQVYDKQLKRNLFDDSKFAVGDVITMHSFGNGAGEFADVQQPDMKGYDRTGLHELIWRIIADGPVYTTIEYKQPIAHAIVRQEVVLYKQLKRIDFHTYLLNWDGTMYREFRQMFPVAASPDKVRYEVPFGSVRVGKDELKQPAGERYIYPCSETRPRGIENWMAAEMEDATVLFTSSVVAWDYLDPTSNPLPSAVLQPVLLASRKSCHGEGNDYDQTGDHAFSFTLTSFSPRTMDDFHLGRQTNEPLFPVFNPPGFENESLPEEKSFFSVDQNQVIISTIKKSESDDAVIIRFFEPVGQQVFATVHSAFPIIKAWHTNLIEETGTSFHANKHDFQAKTGAYSIETIKLVSGK